jgi:DNA repair protein RadC
MPYECLIGPGVAEMRTQFDYDAISVGQAIARASEHGPQALTDAELLAALLRGGDAAHVGRLASELLHYYGSIARIINDPPEHLIGVAGPEAATAIGLMRQLIQRVGRGQGRERQQFNDYLRLHAYLRNRMAGRSVELFMVLYLDHRNGLICETEAEGSIAHAPVYVRNVVHAALSAGAARAVVAHCHPSASKTPSAGDIEMTRRLKEGLATVDIGLLDHVLIAGDEAISFTSKGLL